MKRIIVTMALLIAGLCAFMFYDRYARFLLSGEAAIYPERTGWMWGSLAVIALILAVVASRRA